MNQYAVYTQEGLYLFDIYGESEEEALMEAKRSSRDAYRVQFLQRMD